MRHRAFHTALAAAVATLTAACGGGTDGSPSNPVVTVAHVTVTAPQTSLAEGATLTLSASVLDGSGNVLSGKAISWSSSDNAIATVSAGSVAALKEGSVTITATSGGQSGNVPLTVTRGAIDTVSVAAIQPVTAGGTAQMSAATKTKTGFVLSGRTVTWSSADPTIADVTAAGVLTAKLPGTVAIRATSEGVTGSAAVTVKAPVLAEVEASGLTGHSTAHVADESYKNTYGYGFSYYSTITSANPTVAKVQLGWGVWISPANFGWTGGPLCPVGTTARGWDNGPTWAGVFQSLEGGVGTWGSLDFPSTTTKFMPVATGDCFTNGNDGTAYNASKVLPSNKIGIAQLSNRLLLPPDHYVFTNGTTRAVLGYGWLALPLIPSTTSPLGVPTGNQNWTLFLNTANFQGPSIFWVPEYWTSVAAIDRTSVGRGMDALNAQSDDIGLEIGYTTSITSKAADGTRYRRIPRITFPAEGSQATLMQDARFYSKAALWDAFASWMSGGSAPTTLAAAGTLVTDLKRTPTSSFTMLSDGKPVLFDSISVAPRVSVGPGGSLQYGYAWTSGDAGVFPEYFKETATGWRAVPESSVPRETWLKDQTFSQQGKGTFPSLNTTSATSPWSSAGWAAGPFSATLSDGSIVDYVWYRFVDQPAIKRLGLSDAVRAQLQTFVESLHERFGANGLTIAAPASGSLATLDPGQLVTPPPGMSKGYVPIAIGQR